jgi:DNA modification methylase
MSGDKRPTCRSEVELATLAPGMAKQHERYQDALQELIDNAVSSVVKNEAYFENPDDSVEVVVTLRRTENTVRTTIADNGPGISQETLRNSVFRTGSKEASDGILNNVGWGLKASLAWFEETLSHVKSLPEDPWFTLVASTEDASPYRVDGPITGDLPIIDADNDDWTRGLGIGEHSLKNASSGTRVHVSCSRSKFDSDVWPSAKSLDIKAQSLRESLGVKFRRLLNSHQDNKIYIDYIDETNGTRGSLPVIPINPIYVDDDQEPPTEYSADEFTIEGEDGTEYTVEYKRGTIDFDAMADELTDDHPGLFTTSGRFRTRYRPSQSKQGVDIYANGRVLMTAVFSDLFDLTRNNEYNYFGGEVRIIPEDKVSEVPTDNKKVRLDSNSTLWQQLQETLSQKEYQPEGKRYDDTNNDTSDSGSIDLESVESGTETENNKERTSEVEQVNHTSIESDDDIFTVHQRDSTSLKKTLLAHDGAPSSSEFVDVTITSPPYFDLKDYGYNEEDQIGQRESYDEYLNELREVFSQIYDLTTESGTLWVVVDSFKANREVVQLQHDITSVCQNLKDKQLCDDCGAPLKPDRINHTLRCSSEDCDFVHNRSDDSWLLQDTIVWNKTRGLPYNNDGQFRNVFEYILCFSKTESFNFDVDSTRIADPEEFKRWWVSYPERYHPRGKFPSNIWDYVTPSQGSFGGLDSLDHPAPFPPRLVERILRLTTQENSIVLDPFAGSGMVPAIADIMNRQSIGFELSSEYCEAYPDVRDEVDERFGERLCAEHGPEQTELTKTIGKLRQVKHVHELLRKHVKSSDFSSGRDLSIHTAFHLNKGLDPSAVENGRFMQSEIHYVVDDNVDTETRAALERGLQSIASDGLDSSYGITSTINVHTTNSFLEKIVDSTGKDDTFHLYQNGQHYDYAETLTLRDWVREAVGTDQWRQSYAQDDWPPILSDIELSVDNPHRGTEKSTNEQNTLEKVNKAPPQEADLSEPSSDESPSERRVFEKPAETDD